MLRITTTVVGVVLAGVLSARGEFYVAPTGDDANPGTAAAPFATLERARDAARAVSSDAVPVVVWLHGGDYVRTNSFELSAADINCVYRAVPGETPRFIGGVRLDPTWFTPVTSSSPVWSRLASNAQGNLLEIDLGAHGITNYGTLKPRGFDTTAVAAMELFVDGRPLELGRWPNTGTWATVVSVVSSNQFTYSGTEPSRWSQAEEVWFHGYFCVPWVDAACLATNIDTATKTVSLAARPSYGIVTNTSYFAFNLLEEIDTPGEYYIKRDTGMLYVWPPAGFTNAEILVSVLETTIVHVAGARDIRMDGIEMLAARGYLVQMDGGTNITFSRCRLLGAGSHAATIRGLRSGFANCEIADSGSSGAVLDGGNRYTLVPGQNFVRQSVIHDFSRLSFTGTPGVRLKGVGHTVEHCELYRASNMAIYFTGNEHRLDYNHIHDVCQSTSDAGAIYCGRDWGLRGNRIRFNFIHDVTSPVSGFGVIGIYADGCGSGLEVFGNVLYRIGYAALQNNGGRDNDWENNVVAHCGAFHYSSAVGIYGISTNGDDGDLLAKIRPYNYQNPPWSTAYPALAAIPNDYSQIGPYKTPGGTIFSRNIGWSNTKVYVQWDNAFSYYAEMTGNLTNENPLFVNEAALDLTLQTNSPAYSIPGFQPIPFSQIGTNSTLVWDAALATPEAQDGDGTWDLTANNWWDSVHSTNLAWTGSSLAQFGTAGGGTNNHVCTLGTAISVGALLFENQNYTLTGNTITLAGATPTIMANSPATIEAALAGTAGLVKDGNSTLTLTGPNTYSGGTTINCGTLSINTLADTSPSTLGSNAPLIFIAGALRYTGSSAASTIRTVTNRGIAVLDVSGAGALTWSGVITGGGALLKSGTNTLTLDNANSYGGGTIIAAGTLVIGVSNALPGSTALILGDNGNLANAGTLDLNGFSPTVSALLTTTAAATNALATNTVVNLGAGQVLNLLAGTANNVVDVAEGTHLRLVGGGALNVVATNGAFRIRGYRSSTLASGLDLSQLSSFTASVSNLSVGDHFGLADAGRCGWLWLATNNTVTATRLYVGYSTASGAGFGLVLLGNSNTFHVADLYLGYCKIRGTITATTGPPNQVTITGTNDDTRANLFLGFFNQLNSGSWPTGFLIVTNDGSFLSAQLNQLVAGTLETNASSATAGGRGTVQFINGDINVNTVILGRSQPGTTTGTGMGTLTMSGGQLTVNSEFTLGKMLGSGSVTGIFVLAGGTATVSTDIVDGGGGSTLTINGGTLDLQGHTIGSAIAPINYLNIQSGTLLNVVEINGGAALVKTTGGTLVLAGNNTYTGPTTVSNGTLLVNGSINTGAVTVAAAGTLGGNGTIQGPVTINGTLAPRSSPGTLTISNHLVLAPTATNAFALGSTSDRVNISGTLTLAGTLNITDAGGFCPGTYTIITYTGALTNNGLTIGTTPNPLYSYQFDTTVPGQIRLLVRATPASWQMDNFGSTNSPQAAMTANPAGDGLANLIKYTIGLDPLAVCANPIQCDRVTTNGFTYLRLSTPRDPAVTDVIIEGLSAGALTNWTTNTVIEINTTNFFRVRDTLPIETNVQRFLKLRFSLP